MNEFSTREFAIVIPISRHENANYLSGFFKWLWPTFTARYYSRYLSVAVWRALAGYQADLKSRFPRGYDSHRACTGPYESADTGLFTTCRLV